MLACLGQGFHTALNYDVDQIEVSEKLMKSLNRDAIVLSLLNQTSSLMKNGIDIKEPKILMYAHAHSGGKYHREYVQLNCKIQMFLKSFQKECLKWVDEGMYSIHTDWTWGLILPNEPGAPSLPE